jgi:predicted PurR-regulated permease PerM
MKLEIENQTIVRILLIITGFVVGIWLVMRLERELAWILTALFLAVALDPAVRWFSRMLRAPRVVGVSIVFLLFLALMGFLLGTLVPPLVSQTEELVKALPHTIQSVQDSHSRLGQVVSHYNLVDVARHFESRVVSDLANVGGTTLGIVRGVFSGLLAAITITFLTFFMLLEGPHWLEDFWRAVPRNRRARYQGVAHQIYHAIAGYVTGNLLIVVGFALVTAILLQITGASYAIPLSILAGILTLLPLVGTVVAAFLVLPAAYVTGSLTSVIVVGAFFALFSSVDGHLLRPIVFGKAVELSQLVIVTAFCSGVMSGRPPNCSPK